MTDPAVVLDVLLSEARGSVWRPEPLHEDYRKRPSLWLTNDAGDSLHIDADDVAALVNAALAAEGKPE